MSSLVGQRLFAYPVTATDPEANNMRGGPLSGSPTWLVGAGRTDGGGPPLWPAGPGRAAITFPGSSSPARRRRVCPGSGSTAWSGLGRRVRPRRRSVCSSSV